MGKIVTKDQLVNAIDGELGWRKKELKIFKDLIPSQTTPVQAALLRCSIPILYAHWEGFVKISCQYYLEYVSNKEEKYSVLKPQFITLALNKQLGKLEVKSIEDKTKAIEFIINNLNNKSNIHTTNAIQTKSNLKYYVFKDICFLLDLEFSSFFKYESLINDLVDTRNNIAHGNGHKVDLRTFNEFYKDVLLLLEVLRTELENAVALDNHKLR